MARSRLSLRARRIGFQTRAPVIFGRPGRRGQVGTAAHFRYAASADRVGLALGSATLLGGIVAAALARGNALTVLLAFGAGAIMSAAALIGVGGPIWFAAHRLGRRGPVAAGLGGAATGVLIAAMAQAGVIRSVAGDEATSQMRWTSVAATSVVVALCGAGVALAMWRIAYRRR